MSGLRSPTSSSYGSATTMRTLSPTGRQTIVPLDIIEHKLARQEANIRRMGDNPPRSLHFSPGQG